MVTTISYDKVKEILARPIPLRTKALIAFQYATGCRIGELLPYHHISDYTHKKTKQHIYKEYETSGLLKSNIRIGSDLIEMTIPNFKVRILSKKYKEAYVFKEETWLWNIIAKWLSRCGEQVFDLHESRARLLVRRELYPFASHVLRHSRGTHIVDLFGYSVWDVQDTLGHSDLKSSQFYVSTVERKKKMLRGLKLLNKENKEESENELNDPVF